MNDTNRREKQIMNWTWGNILNAALIISAIGGSFEQFGQIKQTMSQLQDQQRRNDSDAIELRAETRALVADEVTSRKADIERVEREIAQSAVHQATTDSQIMHELEEITQRLDRLIEMKRAADSDGKRTPS